MQQLVRSRQAGPSAPTGPAAITPQNLYSAQGGTPSSGLEAPRTFADGGWSGGPMDNIAAFSPRFGGWYATPMYTNYMNRFGRFRAPQPAAPTGPVAVTPGNMYSPVSGASDTGLSQGRTFADGGIAGLMGQGNPMPQFNVQSGYNNYAAPNAPSMQYPQQGQSNQPQSGAPQQPTPPTLSSQVPSTPQQIGGPDVSGTTAGENMGFDNSGNDGGIGGQPVNQIQTPLQGGGPLSVSQFMSPQGLQIQGNPTSQMVQRPQQR